MRLYCCLCATKYEAKSSVCITHLLMSQRSWCHALPCQPHTQLYCSTRMFYKRAYLLKMGKVGSFFRAVTSQRAATVKASCHKQPAKNTYVSHAEINTGQLAFLFLELQELPELLKIYQADAGWRGALRGRGPGHAGAAQLLKSPVRLDEGLSPLKWILVSGNNRATIIRCREGWIHMGTGRLDLWSVN